MIQKELAKLIIKFEEWNVTEGEQPCLMVSVYTEKGEYVGSLDRMILHIIADKGILPEVAGSQDKTCSIGKSFRDHKWYGWSHRAIHGYQIGDIVEEGSCCASSGWTEEYLKEHPEENLSLSVGFTAVTEEDCKKMAIAFAESVS